MLGFNSNNLVIGALGIAPVAIASLPARIAFKENNVLRERVKADSAGAHILAAARYGAIRKSVNAAA